MKFDYQSTINDIKEKGYIGENDKFVFGRRASKTESNGVLTTTKYSKTDYCVIINKDEVKILNISKKTGEFCGVEATLTREQLRSVWVSKGFLWFFQYDISVKTLECKYDENFLIKNKFNSYNQESMCLEMANLIKEYWTKPYNEAKAVKKSAQ